MTELNLYYVSISWRFKGRKTRNRNSGAAIAATSDEAIAKFKAIVRIPEGALEINYTCWKEEKGVFIANSK
jgi:hypothetical protein